MMRQSKLKWREEGKKFPSLLSGGRLGGGKGWMDRKTKLGEGESLQETVAQHLLFQVVYPQREAGRIISSPSRLQGTPVFFSTTAHSLTPLASESCLKVPPTKISNHTKIPSQFFKSSPHCLCNKLALPRAREQSERLRTRESLAPYPKR